jgi:PHD/YefM family antitoxin component YafN of YafNO toxin-antitoxin module
MSISATKLRQNLYNILDKILESGIPVEIERKGKKLKIIAEEKVSIWNKLEEHDAVSGDSDDFISMDWSNEWNRNNIS